MIVQLTKPNNSSVLTKVTMIRQSLCSFSKEKYEKKEGSDI